MEGKLEKLKRIFSYLTLGGAGSYLLSLYASNSAQATVNVVPRLKEVDFISALLSNHAEAWLFYHFPIPMSTVCVAIGAIAGYLFYRKQYE